jgi:hypothetical protein
MTLHLKKTLQQAMHLNNGIMHRRRVYANIDRLSPKHISLDTNQPPSSFRRCSGSRKRGNTLPIHVTHTVFCVAKMSSHIGDSQPKICLSDQTSFEMSIKQHYYKEPFLCRLQTDFRCQL